MSFYNQIVGTWELVSYYRIDDQGDRFYPLGKDATGFLIYSEDGYMSAQLMAQGRPTYTLEGLHNGTQEEMAKAAHGYHAYSGKYELDSENQTIYHHNEVSMIPNRIGAVQDRIIKINGDQINITSSSSPTNIIWKKVKNNSQK